MWLWKIIKFVIIILITSGIYYFVPITALYTSYSLPNIVLKNTDRYYYLLHFMNKKLSFWQILTTTTKLSLAISLFPSASSKPFSHLFPSHMPEPWQTFRFLQWYSEHLQVSVNGVDTPIICAKWQTTRSENDKCIPHIPFPTYATELSLRLSICIPFLSSPFSSSFWGMI